MSLLDHDELIVDQVTGFMSNDFAICDLDGVAVGSIRTEGDGWSRFFGGTREFSVVDADGTVVMRFNDVATFGLDTFELLDADGQPWGQVEQEFSFFSKRLSVHLPDDDLAVEGSAFDFDFTLTGTRGPVATVTRDHPSFGAMLSGMERYLISFARGATPEQRRGALGATIAIDLIRMKQRRSN